MHTGIFDNPHLLRFGGIDIAGSVVSTWIITLVVAGTAWLATRNLSRSPRLIQVVLEAIVAAIEDAIEGVLPGRVTLLFPFIATLWIFVVTANLFGLLPGMSSPTADLSVTSALAVVVFLSVHYFGIRDQGLKTYLKHYLKPSPVLLPFHIIGEISRTVALAIRLFGNVMSLQTAALLILLVAGFLVPVPLLMLHIVEALIQAYLFGMLALIYIAGGIQSLEIRKEKEHL